MNIYPASSGFSRPDVAQRPAWRNHCSQGNEYHKENVQLSNKQSLFNPFEESFPLQMSNSNQLYTCRNIERNLI